jgi:uncharacterized protein YndB with AHSA1/START domain
MQSSGKTCREIAKLYPSVIACDKREAFAQESEATTCPPKPWRRRKQSSQRRGETAAYRCMLGHTKSLDLYNPKPIFVAGNDKEDGMEVDVARVLGLVTRSVRNFEKDGKAASAVTLTRLYDTDVDDLWDALTSKERIPRWFLPVEGDLQLGGRYQLKGNAGGTITACTPPDHFAATWEFGGATSWIDVSLAADSDRARLTLEHTAIIEDHWNQFGPGAVGIGWDLALAGLERYLATGASVDHETAEAWMGSPDGKGFMTQSGEFWRAAHVASGVDPASAKQRSDRTIAFYRGEIPPDMAHPGTGS